MEYYKNLSLENIIYKNDNAIECIELWKDVVGYEKIYQISDLGRAKRLSEYRFSSRNNSMSLYKEKIIKQTFCKPKYLGISCSYKNKVKTMSIHQLVAMAFLNYIPNGNKLVVDHIDNNQLNNCLNNLQIISNRQNTSKDKKNTTSKYTGVCWRKDLNKWQSSISIRKYGLVSLILTDNELFAKKHYDIALQNLDKYEGDNVEFRKLIKKLCL